MKNLLLEELFDSQNSGRDRYVEERQRIETNTGMLKKDFDKWQRRMLLRIIDDKDLIAEKWAVDSFAAGARCGVMFMIELFSN